MPVRIENIQPSGAFLYELASRNWVNAYDNRQAALTELAHSLAKLVKAGIPEVFCLNGGMSAWQAQSLPVVGGAATVAKGAA